MFSTKIFPTILILLLSSFSGGEEQTFENTPPKCSQVRTVRKPGNVYIVFILSLWSEFSPPLFDMSAFIHHYAVAFTIFQQIDTNVLDQIGYISFDVCNDKEFLTEVITSLMLEKEYLLRVDTPERPGQSCHCLKSSEAVLAVFGYMPDDMLKLTATLLLPADVPFFAVNKQNLFPDPKYSHPYLIPIGRVTNEAVNLKELIEYFHWEKVAIICYSCSDDNMVEYFRQAWQIFRTSLCVAYQRYTNDAEVSVDNITEILARDSTIDVVILWGEKSIFRSNQIKLVAAASRANLTGKVWILQDDSLSIYLQYHKIPRNILHGLITRRNFVRLLRSSTSFEEEYSNNHSDVENDDWIRNVKSGPFSQIVKNLSSVHSYNLMYGDVVGLIARLVRVYYEFQKNLDKVKEKMSYELKNNIRYFNQNTTGVPYHPFFFDHSQQIVFTSQDVPSQLTWPNNQGKPQAKCFKRSCPPGQENRFDLLQNHETIWEREQGWTCKPCEKGQYKFEHGTANCKVCAGLNVTDAQKITCYYPFQKIYTSTFGLGMVLAICVAFAGFCWNCSAFAVMVKFRNTPCVKSSDFLMTCIQLFSFLMFFPVITIVSLYPPSKLACTLQPCVIGILLTFSISITLSKTQKLLFAFQAKKKLTRKAVLLTKAAELLIIGCFMFTEVCLLVVSLTQFSVAIAETLSRKEFEHYIYCNTDGLVHIQVVFILLVTVGCIVQAFRARNLPQNYNEAKFILYAMLLLNLCLAILFPLYFSQPNPVTRSIINLVLILLGTTIFSVILYGSKLYIILFKPERNTQKVFRQMLMDNMKKTVIKETNKRERKKQRSLTKEQHRHQFLSSVQRTSK